MAGSAATFGTVVVVGGGCYGAYYVRQLARAARAGAVGIREVLVVDRDAGCRVAREREALAGPLTLRMVVGEWEAFFDAWLGDAAGAPDRAAHDAIVPSPLMPHLLYRWVVARLRQRCPGRTVESRPLGDMLPVPWQRTADDATQYASFATWMCPVNCVEPARCPHTRAARDWTMPVALQRYVADRPLAGPFVFHCTHRAYGVGMIDVAAVLAADAALARHAANGPVDAIVGTVSHCHGAVGRIVVGS